MAQHPPDDLVTLADVAALAGMPAGDRQRHNAAFHQPAVMRSCRDFLTDITAFLKIDRAKPVEPGLKHQGALRLQVDRALRHTGGNAHRLPFISCRDLRAAVRRRAVSADPSPAKIGMARVGGAVCRHVGAVPAKPDRVVFHHLKRDRAAKPVAAKPGEQVIGARCVTVQKVAVSCAPDHHVRQNPPLRCQQRAGAYRAARQRLDIGCQDRLQKVAGLFAGDADHPAAVILGHLRCGVRLVHFCAVSLMRPLYRAI